MRIIISGGGTGGHIFPAIAIADALKRKVSDADILFVGANGKMEMQRVPKAGYKIEGLDIAGLQRKLTWKNLLLPYKVLRSLLQARNIVKTFKPQAVIGVGGYASGPVMKVANWQRIPTFLQEQNSYAGVTNKILAKSASRIYVAYKAMERFFPKDKILITGNPVREVFVANTLSKEAAQSKLDVSVYSQVVFVCGGSLGAKTINEAMINAYDMISKDTQTLYYWQVGKLYIDKYSQDKISRLANVQMTAFVEDMAAAYAMADIVVSRAGALSISELCVMGKPSILIPSPNVAEDHQTHNAMSLVDEDAAILVRDSEAVSQLGTQIATLLNDKKKQELLSENIKRLAKKDAATVIADDIIRHLNMGKQKKMA